MKLVMLGTLLVQLVQLLREIMLIGRVQLVLLGMMMPVKLVLIGAAGLVGY
jgi:hypothetical protein